MLRPHQPGEDTGHLLMEELQDEVSEEVSVFDRDSVWVLVEDEALEGALVQGFFSLHEGDGSFLIEKNGCILFYN